MIIEVERQAWCRDSHESLPALLRENGAALIRGLDIRDATGLEQFAADAGLSLFTNYSELPSLPGSSSYRVTPYPARHWIQFHGEAAHRPQWPSLLLFCCEWPAADGGGTPVVDTRRVRQRLPASFVDAVERHGLRYDRRFLPGLDQPWQEVFGTDDPQAVEAKCREVGTRCTFDRNGPRIQYRCQPLRNHPQSDEPIFFSQLLLHHPRLLPAEVREAAELLFGAGALPRDVRYGDGSVIPDDIVDAIHGMHHDLALSFAWESGDVLVVDNLIAAHAREPFTGERSHFTVLADHPTA